MKKLDCMLFFLPVLSGCISGSGFSSAERLRNQGWADVRQEDILSQSPTYCYKTLGHIDCYDHPQPGNRRLVTPYPYRTPPRHFGAIDLKDDDLDMHYPAQSSAQACLETSQSDIQSTQSEQPLQ